MLLQEPAAGSTLAVYVQAVAARTGVVPSKPDPDLGIDLSLRAVRQDGNVYQDAGVLLDLQLRSTTRAAERPTQIAYDIDVRTYDFLRTAPPMCPRLLVRVGAAGGRSRVVEPIGR